MVRAPASLTALAPACSSVHRSCPCSAGKTGAGHVKYAVSVCHKKRRPACVNAVSPPTNVVSSLRYMITVAILGDLPCRMSARA